MKLTTAETNSNLIKSITKKLVEIIKSTSSENFKFNNFITQIENGKDEVITLENDDFQIY